jgi:hypothetical protein
MSMPLQVRHKTHKQLYGNALGAVLESGNLFDQSIALARDPAAYEKFDLDATIMHLKQVRKHMVAGSRWELKPASTKPADKTASAFLEQMIRVGTKRLAVALFNLSEAVFRGSAYGRIVGEKKWVTCPDGIPRQCWVPTLIEDVDRRRFDKTVERVDLGTPNERYVATWKMFSPITRGWEKWEHPEWYVKHIYSDAEASLGYGQGLYDSMFFLWRAREVLLKMGLQGAERWAQGFMVASVDNARSASTGKTNAAIVNSFITELEKQRSQHFFVKDKLDLLDVLPGPGQGHEIVMKMLEYVDMQLRLLALGSNLPTKAEGGGSYNLAEIQQGTTDAIVKYDRKILGESLTRDFLGLTWDLNRPALFSMGLAAAELPGFTVLDDKVIDPKYNAEVSETLLRAGFKLKADEAYELVQRTQPGPGDEYIEQKKPEPLGFPPGAGAPLPPIGREEE